MRRGDDNPCCVHDLLAPIWHFIDVTPQGRGNWYANLDYSTKVQAAST
jgi:hypothetical protein